MKLNRTLFSFLGAGILSGMIFFNGVSSLPARSYFWDRVESNEVGVLEIMDCRMGEAERVKVYGARKIESKGQNLVIAERVAEKFFRDQNYVKESKNMRKLKSMVLGSFDGKGIGNMNLYEYVLWCNNVVRESVGGYNFVSTSIDEGGAIEWKTLAEHQERFFSIVGHNDFYWAFRNKEKVVGILERENERIDGLSLEDILCRNGRGLEKERVVCRHLAWYVKEVFDACREDNRDARNTACFWTPTDNYEHAVNVFMFREEGKYKYFITDPTNFLCYGRLDFYGDGEELMLF